MCAAPAGKFFWFLLFNLLTLTYFTFFGKHSQLLLQCSAPFCLSSSESVLLECNGCLFVIRMLASPSHAVICAVLDDIVLLCRNVGCCSDTNPAAGCRVLRLPLLHVQPLCWLFHDSTQHARLVVSSCTFSALSVISPLQHSDTAHHRGLLLKKLVACCLSALGRRLRRLPL